MKRLNLAYVTERSNRSGIEFLEQFHNFDISQIRTYPEAKAILDNNRFDRIVLEPWYIVYGRGVKDIRPEDYEKDHYLLADSLLRNVIRAEGSPNKDTFTAVKLTSYTDIMELKKRFAGLVDEFRAIPQFDPEEFAEMLRTGKVK